MLNVIINFSIAVKKKLNFQGLKKPIYIIDLTLAGTHQEKHNYYSKQVIHHFSIKITTKQGIALRKNQTRLRAIEGSNKN